MDLEAGKAMTRWKARSSGLNVTASQSRLYLRYQAWIQNDPQEMKFSISVSQICQ
jgi:hypothetical protein